MPTSVAAAAAALQALEERALRRLRRRVDGFAGDLDLLHPVVGDGTLVNFCSNDYLGLARDPRLVEAMVGAARGFGAGSGAAHLVTGHSRLHHELEEQLAALSGRESALLFSTGYMANLGVISTFAQRGSLVVEDRLNHASLLDGARVAGAKLLRSAHASAEAAAARLAAQGAGAGTALLVTDGVFSMDGDVAPVAALARVAREAGAVLVVDDAHGFGVTGPGGRGTLAAAGLTQAEAPLVVGTLGKAFGAFGAFVAGPGELVELVMQTARSYIYTTALPPPVAAAALRGVEIALAEDWRRAKLAELVARFRAGAEAHGLVLLPSSTPIQPVLVGDAARCVAASDALRARGWWVAAIRPPTVPAGSARLRVTLSAAHTIAEVDGLVTALGAVLR